MKYMKNKYGDENGNVISFWSTDDNVLCEDGKTLRENLNEVDTQFKDITDNLKLTYDNNILKLMLGTKELSSITINSGTVTPTPKTYTITNNLSHASNSNGATSVKEGTSYSATITADSNYRIKNVIVLMGGVDITNSAYSGGRISISAVTGNISITVTTEYVSSEVTRYTITNNLSHAKIVILQHL